MRRFGQPPLPAVYYPPRPGAYGIFWRDGRILLTTDCPDAPNWQLPGGGIDAGESPLPALIREAYEETGWHVQVRRKFGQYRRYVFMPDYGRYADKICGIYEGRAIARRGTPSEARHRARFFTPNAALDLMIIDAERHMLAHCLAGR